jgi:hypothetical protein
MADTVSVRLANGDVVEMRMTVSSGPFACGWYDPARQVWVHELHHVDGRIERFTSPTFPGELTEDND